MMNEKIVNDLFVSRNNLNLSSIFTDVNHALSKADDGELFLEYSENESIVMEDSKIKTSSFSINSGFGLRAIYDELSVYSSCSEISNKNISKSANYVLEGYNARSDSANKWNDSFNQNHKRLYSDINPLVTYSFEEKVKILTEIDIYLRSKDSHVKQVSASMLGGWQVVAIIKQDGQLTYDVRPLVRLNISVIVEKNGKLESGGLGVGARTNYSDFTSIDKIKEQADEALRQAMVMVEAKSSPAGEMKVVLGPGWPGVLLHEAVGHGLEGDFNRKKLSAFSELMGKQVAAKGVTVIDDGTIEGRRGSLNIDDEGTPSQKNILIEDGILCGYMFDRLNARLMNVRPTGNGRRQSYAYQPMPRMTNTYMLGGEYEHEELIKMVDKGIYAANFGGGQVDITSGKFVFSASEAYLIENGKISHPVKGATLIGSGPDSLKRIKAIGNNLELDKGVGTCGKNGQSVPVGVGQPSLLIAGMTVGGTEI